ncbi:addiction module protein [Acinetobacter sp. NIPH 2699]|uniref:addiction module protein n=1 Tax=Acinetobacter sp. NIPH 2699 TaxID=2923433 RepID=UPI001F4AC59B|nr:addiction module protein [Acinetobacter sp. NIPH 2699]MCH7335831.1 addiction module protein [Acinetobacter sp. NIPH 2699]
MTTAFPIDQLTKIEKLQLIERLWQDLSTESDLLSPQWHADVLQKTEALVATKQNQFVDWQDAKKRLQKKT